MGESYGIGEILRELSNTKKLLTAVVKSFENDSGGGWQWYENEIAAHFGGSIFQLWREWRRHGQYPTAGGWLEQPLSLLVRLNAIEMVYTTYKHKHTKDFDWKLFTPFQREIIRQLDNETEENE